MMQERKTQERQTEERKSEERKTEERKTEERQTGVRKTKRNSKQVSKLRVDSAQGGRDKELLADEIQEKLDWYIMHTAEEDYDEKVVDSFLRLLDSLEPLKEEVPKADDAWMRFQEMVKYRELRSAENEAVSNSFDGKHSREMDEERVELSEELCDLNSIDRTRSRTEELSGSFSGELHDDRKEAAYSGGEKEMYGSFSGGLHDDRKDGMYSGFQGELHGDRKEAMYNGVAAERNKSEDMAGNASNSDGSSSRSGNLLIRHRYITAAVLLALALGAFGTVQTMASPDTGFFHWLKRDETGTEMITLPENLDGSTGKRENAYYNRDDVPDWADEWLEVEAKFEMPEEYEWERYEVNVVENVQEVVSFYQKHGGNEEILLGMILYMDRISYNKESFFGYDYVEDYEIGKKHLEVYSKVEESGKKYYIVCFEGCRCQYFVRGQNSLDELKIIAEQYYDDIKNNL